MHSILVRIQKCDEMYNSKSSNNSLGTVVDSLEQVLAQKLKRNVVTCFYDYFQHYLSELTLAYASIWSLDDKEFRRKFSGCLQSLYFSTSNGEINLKNGYLNVLEIAFFSST